MGKIDVESIAASLVSEPLRSRLLEHLERNRVQPDSTASKDIWPVIRSIQNRVIAADKRKSTIVGTALTSVIFAGVTAIEDYEEFKLQIESIHTIDALALSQIIEPELPRRIFQFKKIFSKSSNPTAFDAFALTSISEPLANCYYSYVIALSSVSTLTKLLIAADSAVKDNQEMSPDIFLKVAESYIGEMKDYPVEWIFQTVDTS